MGESERGKGAVFGAPRGREPEVALLRPLELDCWPRNHADIHPDIP
jgi:hypothetical protein